MQVAYIFMNYPAPSEVFGEVEVASLERQDIRIKRYSLLSQRKVKNCFYPSSIATFKAFFSSNTLVSYFKFVRFAYKISLSVDEFLKLVVLYPRAVCLLKRLVEDKSDMWHLFWGHYPSVLLWLAKYHGLPQKISIFTGAYDLVGMSGIMKWGVNNADLVFTHAACNIHSIQTFFNGPVHLSYRGVNLQAIKHAKSSESKNSSIKICFAGRLITSKKADLVLEVYQKFSRVSSVPSELHFFGEGPEEADLKSLSKTLEIDDSVHFHGHVPQSIMFEMYNGFDFIIFPSQHISERLPNAVKEAMAHGIIPICSYTPGIDELVIHEVNGYILDKFTTESCFKLLDEIIQNKKNIQVVSENARNQIKMAFDVDKISSDKIKLFKGVIS